MTVVQSYINGESARPHCSGHVQLLCDAPSLASSTHTRGTATCSGVLYSDAPPAWEALNVATRELLVELIAVNSSYSSQCVPPPPPAAADALHEHIGNRTECGLLGFLLHLGQSYQAIRERHPEESFRKVFTFNSKRKSMSTVLPLPAGDGGGSEGFRVCKSASASEGDGG